MQSGLGFIVAVCVLQGGCVCEQERLVRSLVWVFAWALCRFIYAALTLSDLSLVKMDYAIHVKIYSVIKKGT